MFPCPHCGNKIDVGPRAEVAWWQYESGRTPVSLGCGTLILIAIIVIVFSGGKNRSSEIRSLQNEIQTLEQKIDNLAAKQIASPQAAAAENN